MIDKIYKELHRFKIRQTNNLFLIETLNAIDKAKEYNINIIDKFSITDTLGFKTISKHEMNKITGRNFIEYVAIGQYVRPELWNRGPYILCDNINDYGNLGSIIRSCYAFNYTNIIIFHENKDFFHHKVFESSRYFIFKSIPYYISNKNECLDFLNNKNVIITGLNGQLINRKITQNDVIVFSNESNGVSDFIEQKANETFTIPTSIESLNVSNAAAITLFHFNNLL